MKDGISMAPGLGEMPSATISSMSQEEAEQILARDLAEQLKQTWLEEDRTGRIDHEWASRLDLSLTLAVLGMAFDLFSREFPGVFPEMDRCNLADGSSTRITFRRDYRL